MELFGSGIIEFRRPAGIFDRRAIMVYALTESVAAADGTGPCGRFSQYDASLRNAAP
jgi:hypothetical protein